MHKALVRRLVWLVVVLAAGVLAACSARNPQGKTPLVVFVAGSFMIPEDALEKAYAASHPNVDFQMQAHGSIQVMRHVTDIHEKIDVVVTADQALIPMLMYSTKDPDTDKPYANWYAQFATNRLSLAYTPTSKYASEINASNWYEIIARPDVKVGLPDPRFDPSGYRSLMALQLAERHYKKAGIYGNVMVGQFKSPITARESGDRTVVHVPEIVDTKPDSNIVIRGASMMLIALLESGDIDYSWEYESVVRQHNLSYVPLPGPVNLGEERYAADYAKVGVQLDFQRFATVKPEFNGEVIGYGVTIPSNAPHPKEAAEYVAFLLGPEGQAILRAQQQPLIVPALAHGAANMPPAIRALCVPAPGDK